MTAVDDAAASVLPRLHAGTARKVTRLLAGTVLFDVLVLLSATTLAAFVRVHVMGGFAASVQELQLRSGTLVVAVWLALLSLEGCYARRFFGAGPEEFRRGARASVLCLGLVGLGCFLLEVPFSRRFLVGSFLLGTPLLLVERYVVRQSVHALRRRGRWMHPVVAVGGRSGIREVVEALARNRYVGYEIVGACLPSGVTPDADFPVAVVGRVSDTRRICEEMGADTVLVARGGYASALELRQIAWQLEGSEIDLVVVPSLTDVAGPRIHMRPVAGLPLLHVEQPQAGKAGGHSKRSFDLVLSTLGLVLLAPVFGVVALIVKLQDGGPVFFHQARVGRDGRPFKMLKFRSMVPDAERRLDDLRDLNESDGLLFKMREDPRITPIGRVLRRYSIDELPQLINVLRGDMSLVGPRPPLPSEVDLYAAAVHRRLLVRPGLTGLWQVSGRSSLSWEESVRLDLFYVDNWSMTSDLVIMAKTVKAVLGSSGAY